MCFPGRNLYGLLDHSQVQLFASCECRGSNYYGVPFDHVAPDDAYPEVLHINSYAKVGLFVRPTVGGSGKLPILDLRSIRRKPLLLYRFAPQYNEGRKGLAGGGDAFDKSSPSRLPGCFLITDLVFWDPIKSPLDPWPSNILTLIFQPLSGVIALISGWSTLCRQCLIISVVAPMIRWESIFIGLCTFKEGWRAKKAWNQRFPKGW